MAVFGGMVSGAMGQGLLSIGGVDVDSEQGFTTTVGVGGGYDNIKYGSGPKVDSGFATAGVGVANGWGSKVSRYNTGAQGNVVYYFNDRGRTDDTFYNARAHFRAVHEVNRRFKLGANVYGAYEYEPDYAVGASTGRIEDQYFYGSAHVDAAYQWTRRISTVTGYTFSAIRYDDRVAAASEDRLSHIFSQEARYALSRTTTGTAEYRYRFTDYDTINADYTSHTGLLGIDHAWSERSTISAKGGAEWRDSDRAGDVTRPYAEVALNHRLSRKTGVRWYHWLGLDDSDLDSYRNRYSYRTGVAASTRLTDKLSAHAGLHYVYSDLDGTDEVTGITEHQAQATVGLTYSLNQIWALNANYGFTTIASDDSFRDYDRHRVTLGATASF